MLCVVAVLGVCNMFVRLVPVLQWKLNSCQNGNVNHLTDWDVGQALLHFKSLKSLALHSRIPDAACWIAPGEHRHFVHSIHVGSCPTLKKVIFSPLMVWYLRAVPTGAGECHCERELLSPRTIRAKLQKQVMKRQACDWKGRLAHLLREAPSALSEVEVERIVKPEA
jgi:hypothetical protein